MNIRKSIIYTILIVLGLILIYNFLFVPLLIQNYGQYHMGMGMHMQRYNSYNSYINFGYVFALAGIIVLVLVYDLLFPRSAGKNLCKCGQPIESKDWRICPNCGKRIN